MSARLCAQCCQWVWSRDGLCPDCQDLLLSQVDPHQVAERARALTGAILRRIGEVSLQRKRLPNSGVLYLTELGWFFLPHRQVVATKLVEEQTTSYFWSLAAILWFPLRLLLPFTRRKQLRSKYVETLEPIRLGSAEIQLLPDLLARVPGAFFIPARDVSTIKPKRRRWIVERFAAPDLVVIPDDPDEFQDQLDLLSEIDPWRAALER